MPSATIIAFHGCCQTASAFEGYLNNLTRILKPLQVSLKTVEAKHEHSRGGLTWYPRELDISQIPGGIPYSAELVKDCMSNVDQAVSDAAVDGPVILLGFSQGGNVVDTYLNYRYREHHAESASGPVIGAIILSGYALVDPDRQPVTVPLLSLYSPSDTIVPPQVRPNRGQYSNLTEIEHQDGHNIPKSSTLRQMKSWLASRLCDYYLVPHTKSNRLNLTDATNSETVREFLSASPEHADSIKVLDLSGSKNLDLTTIVALAAVLPNLEAIVLRGSNLASINAGQIKTLTAMPKLRYLDLTGTPAATHLPFKTVKGDCLSKIVWMSEGDQELSPDFLKRFSEATVIDEVISAHRAYYAHFS